MSKARSSKASLRSVARGRSASATLPAPRRARAPRSDIFERAAELMTVKGFAGMSARDLADALEFSKANVFYHLGSKEELLHRIFVDTLEHFIQNVEQIFSRTDSPEAKLRALVDFYITQMFERWAVMTVWSRERGHLSREHAEHVTRLETRLIGMVARFYEEAIGSGAFRPLNPIVARMAMFGMCFNFTRRPELRDQLTMETISTQLQDIACRAMLSPRRR
jgi:AcrR family transcriptional regulator